jgi:hypothetical protein
MLVGGLVRLRAVKGVCILSCMRIPNYNTWHIRRAVQIRSGSNAELAIAIVPPTLDAASCHDGARVPVAGGDGDGREA